MNAVKRIGVLLAEDPICQRPFFNLICAGRDLPAAVDVRTLFGGEEVEDVQVFENLLADAVDAADALDDTGRVPGNVVVDDQARSVEVVTLAHAVGGQKHLIVVNLLVFRPGGTRGAKLKSTRCLRALPRVQLPTPDTSCGPKCP